MKYYFTVSKEDDEEKELEGGIDRKFPFNHGFRKTEVFSCEIEPDEMIELMEHLWHIANRKGK